MWLDYAVVRRDAIGLVIALADYASFYDAYANERPIHQEMSSCLVFWLPPLRAF
jgi:hypothetical protein